MRETRQSEDCLSLNICTASLDREALQPVMLWIHGGGYLGGSGSEDAYDGASLARLGVTVVTFNNRLAAFGFLAHPDAGTNENAVRYFIKPGGPQLPFPRNIGVAILNLVKPGGIYSWTIVEKIATALCGAHVQQVMDILRRSGKTPYECLDWLMSSLIGKEPAHQTAERFVTLNRLLLHTMPLNPELKA